MFSKLRRARADLAMMNTLLPAAEQIARDDGIERPGAEHLLLASLALEDGIAKTALREFGVEPDDLRAAIIGQHDEALRAIGVLADDNAIDAAMPPSGAPPTGPYRAQGSLQSAFQRAVVLAKHDKAALNGGYVVLAVTEPEAGTVARALGHLGVDRTRLRDHAGRLLAR